MGVPKTYEYLVCRFARHAWKFVGFFRDGSEVRAEYRCRECPTVREDWLTSLGEVAFRRYTYPDGYRLPQGNRAVDYRKAMLRRSRIH